MIELNLDAPAPSLITLRDYQVEAVAKVKDGWGQFSRQGLDMPTGTGKTSIASALAKEEWEQRGLRTLVLENRDALVRQTAKRLSQETGLDADIEMAGDHASPFAPIVVGSVPTLCRDARLTGFSDQHFGLIIVDECHHHGAKSFQKVANYFHYGASSLAEDWEAPLDGTYSPIAKILGVSATWELAGNKTLADYYQAIAHTYPFWAAVHDGWLVPPKAVLEPLAADLKGLRATRTSHGSDYNPTEVAERMVPIIGALAKLFVRVASDRKSMAFMPSIKTAAMLSDAINQLGLRSIFVSGECLDRDEKTEEFVGYGSGIALVTSAMYVEGFDCPDVDCVFPGITKSPSYYKQKVGRATRPLKGTVDGFSTAEERRAAIAGSNKKDFLIIDPFFRLENEISLCDVYWLYSDKEEIREKMKALGPPSAATAEKSERDFIKALEKEAKKHARKKGKIINPLTWAVELGDEKLAGYVPERAWEMSKPSEKQLDFIRRNHIDPTPITTAGLAQKVIGILMTRITLKLATPVQLDFMRQLGVQHDGSMTAAQASEAIDEALAEKKQDPAELEKGVESCLTFALTLPPRTAWRFLGKIIKGISTLLPPNDPTAHQPGTAESSRNPSTPHHPLPPQAHGDLILA